MSFFWVVVFFRRKRKKKNDVDSVNVILNYRDLKDLVENNLCCKKCEEKEREEMLDNFANFVSSNKTRNVNELLQDFKKKQTRTKKIYLARDTIGLSTNLSCKCENGCHINIPHDTLKWDGKRHGRCSENFAINVDSY